MDASSGNCDIIDRYQNNPRMEYFRGMVKRKLKCDDIIELIKYKIKMIFEFHKLDTSKFDQNLFVCDMLHDCQNYNAHDDVNAMKLPLQIRKIEPRSRIQCVLNVWIRQEGMQNVLTKDLINLVLKYCPLFTRITRVGEIFARIQDLTPKT